MKVELVEKEFKPVKITLETQDEVDRLFAIINFIPIDEVLNLHEDNWALLWDELNQCKSSGYNKYHDRLSAIVD